MSDRVKQAFLAFIYSAFPRIDYMALYRAKLVSQSGMAVDVQPDDPRLPGLSGVTLRVGIPGATMTVVPGAYLLVGWDGGDPSKPYATPIWDGGETVLKLTLSVGPGGVIQLGGDNLVVAPGPTNSGVVLGSGVDTFTGSPYSVLGSASAVVLAKKV